MFDIEGSGKSDNAAEATTSFSSYLPPSIWPEILWQMYSFEFKMAPWLKSAKVSHIPSFSSVCFQSFSDHILDSNFN